MDSDRVLKGRSRLAFALALSTLACGASIRRFPLKDPLLRDTDLSPVSVPCHQEPDSKDPAHPRAVCAPETYVSPLAWDGVDNSIFRPLSEAFAVAPGGEAPNVNSLDEVPDSAWFTNRIGQHPISNDDFARGACEPAQLIDGESATDGSWVIDQGKSNGSSAGFRVRIPGKGKYVLKSDGNVPEHPSAASVIGAAAYNAVGFNTSCEQVVYVKASVFRLTPGLTTTDNSEVTKPFDAPALKRVLDGATHRGQAIRFQASAWLPGHLVGPFRYEKTRDDDPNDIIPHEDRRELRGGRLLAAWLDHFDAREQNTMDSWISSDPKNAPEASPGYVRHYYLDTSDCLGSEWEWDEISRRLGHAYLLDWGFIGADFVSLGIPTRAWDTARRTPGMEIFGYYSTRNFVPEDWVNEYPNPAFSRMTERDGAWMARILARVTPPLVRTLAAMGQFSNPAQTEFLGNVLQGRLDAVLSRYLSRLSPVADVRVDEGARVCGTDLARLRGVRAPTEFHYSAELRPESGPSRPLSVAVQEGGGICMVLPHVAGDDARISDAARYGVVSITNGVATGPLVIHLYDLGPQRGFRLVGLERPQGSASGSGN